MSTITESELRALAAEAEEASSEYAALGMMNAYHPDAGERAVRMMRYHKARIRDEKARKALYDAMQELAQESA